ncbi:tyrosine phosphatase family-domain-containing protein [Geranomyces variabilis]|nr:tyrosine phosphatase family-domain-containing protein [Geranomyces variabilis]KAJ3135542.1 hypothetical protein HDU90_003945 [Geranomyces variabilis]
MPTTEVSTPTPISPVYPPPPPPSQLAPQPSAPLYPPFRYGMVEEDLYRGAYPKPRNHAFLARLGLRTILSLTPDPANPSLAVFCAANRVTPLHVRVDKPKDHIPLSFAKTAQILSILVDPRHHPLFVHCLDGAGVTAAVIMCLRRLQCWTMAPILAESTRYHKEGVIGAEEAEFVEKFNAEIELGPRLPRWLWGGSVSFKKHPSLRIKMPVVPGPRTATGSSSATGATHGAGGMQDSGPQPQSVMDNSEFSAEGAGGIGTGSRPGSGSRSPAGEQVPGGNEVTSLAGGAGSLSSSIGSSDASLARKSFDAGALLHGRTAAMRVTTALASKDHLPSPASSVGGSASVSAAATPTTPAQSSRGDLRREKEDLRRRAVTENLLNADAGGRIAAGIVAGGGGDGGGQAGMGAGDDEMGRAEAMDEMGMDEDEGGMSMALQALALEMSTVYTKGPK